MNRTEARLERVECEMSFKMWFRRERMFDAMNIEELETLAATGQWPDRPEPARGRSRLDLMDHPSLIKLWREDLEKFAGRNSGELEFYALHGHWAEEDALKELETITGFERNNEQKQPDSLQQGGRIPIVP